MCDLAAEVQRSTRQHHRQKHGDISAEYYVRQSDGRFASHPRLPDDGLRQVIDFLTPLRRLVLHTPLADLLKGEWGNLPPASDTVRHADSRLSALAQRVETCSPGRL